MYTYMCTWLIIRKFFENNFTRSALARFSSRSPRFMSGFSLPIVVYLGTKRKFTMHVCT